MPGDIFLINEPATIPCDAVLLTDSVVVDEATLTGEPHPVQKIPIDKPNRLIWRVPVGPGNRVFGGTTVVQAPEKAIAVVTEIGSRTVRGQMVQVASRFSERVMRLKRSIVNMLLASVNSLVDWFMEVAKAIV